jgi:hypothetical protein
MMAVRPATTTVAFVDTYCATYRDLFADVRSFDHFTRVHLGQQSSVPRDPRAHTGDGLAAPDANRPPARGTPWSSLRRRTRFSFLPGAP